MRLFILPFHILLEYLQGNSNGYAYANILHIAVYISLTLIWFFFFDLSPSLSLYFIRSSFLPFRIYFYPFILAFFTLSQKHTHSVRFGSVQSHVCNTVGLLCGSHIKIRSRTLHHTHLSAAAVVAATAADNDDCMQNELYTLLYAYRQSIRNIWYVFCQQAPSIRTQSRVHLRIQAGLLANRVKANVVTLRRHLLTHIQRDREGGG